MKSTDSSAALPSIRSCIPLDFGGVAARNGFAYQDEIAAHYCLQMLLDSSLKEVWCETYDDIVLIWDQQGDEVVEFVQVKSELPSGLWTIARLCSRPDGIGSSLLEKSLARERCAETARFCLVLARQLSSELEVLTRSFGHADRSEAHLGFKELTENVGTKVADFKSPKGNGYIHWLINGRCWNVAEGAISAINEGLLQRALEAQGAMADSALTRFIYEHLLGFVKKTAEFKAPDLAKKQITKAAFVEKLAAWLDPYPGSGKTARLERKLIEAGLDDTYVNVAAELRRAYMKARRQPGYLTIATDDLDHFDISVQMDLLRMLASLDSNEISDSGPQFHHRCLKAVSSPSGVTSDLLAALPAGYDGGCMYEITARCRHRFSKLI